MQEQIKSLRLQIDGLAQLNKELKPCKISYGVDPTYKMDNSKEIEYASNSLYLAKAWLGKVLEEIGSENPYGSGYKTVEDIVPTQDVNLSMTEFLEAKSEDSIAVKDWLESNHVERVDFLRTFIQKIIDEVKQMRFSNVTIDMDTQIIHTNYTNCYTHLCEAKFQLGFELARVKENQEINKPINNN